MVKIMKNYSLAILQKLGKTSVWQNMVKTESYSWQHLGKITV